MKKILTATMLAASCFLANTAFAGDTNEVLDKGTMEIAPAFTLDNLHDGKPSIGAEIGVGYGVLDELTIGTALYMYTAEAFFAPDAGIDIYMVYTPYDSDHFDIDIMMDFDIDGLASEASYTWTPSFEFNYDYEPDQALWGLYARLGLPITSGPGMDDIVTDVGLDVTLGLYITVAEIHQILIEGGFVVENLAEELGETEVLSNPLTIGYNVALLDNFELTTELAFYIPNIDSDDEFAAALSIGGLFAIGGSSESSESSESTGGEEE